MRPTHGRIDISGAMPMAPSFDVVGWFAQGPGVFRKVGQVLLQGECVSAPIARVLIAEDALENADPAVAAVLMDVLERAAEVLPPQEHGSLASGQFDTWREAFRIVQAREVWESNGDFVTRAKPSLGPGVKERMAFAETVTKAQADAARAVLSAAREHLHALVSPGTIVALPTAPSIAPRVDLSGDEMEAFRTRVMRLTCSAGIGGLPQVSLPAGSVQGCPIGLSLLGWHGGDESLLDLAVSIAKFLGRIG
jgi:amidase